MRGIRSSAVPVVVAVVLVGCGDEAGTAVDGEAGMPADARLRDAGVDAERGGGDDAGRAGDGGRDAGPEAGPGATVCPEPGDGTPFVTNVVSFDRGMQGGFHAEQLPGVVRGPPRGGGSDSGSTDVVSLGIGGSIVVELDTPVVDGMGPDFIVFENPFEFGGGIFVEPGAVSVSRDGEHFTEFSCEQNTSPDYPGCAGIEPVFANAETNDLDPTDPEVAGGDAFDLADVGLDCVRFVRITDVGGGSGFGGEKEGFDLDAVSVVNAP